MMTYYCPSGYYLLGMPNSGFIWLAYEMKRMVCFGRDRAEGCNWTLCLLEP